MSEGLYVYNTDMNYNAYDVIITCEGLGLGGFTVVQGLDLSGLISLGCFLSQGSSSFMISFDKYNGVNCIL